MLFTFNKITLVRGPTSMNRFASPRALVFVPFSFINKSIGVFSSSDPMLLVIKPIAGVLESGWVIMLAFSVSLAINPVAPIIGSQSARISALAMKQITFKMPFINATAHERHFLYEPACRFIEIGFVRLFHIYPCIFLR